MPGTASTKTDPAFDVFISHASEDKDGVVRALAAELTRGGARVWYDELTLRIGDNLRRKIDEGLANSRFGVVVLSPSFFSKEWPQAELDALFAREMNGTKVILPVWHQLTKQQVAQFSPLMAGRLAARTEAGISEAAAQILELIKERTPSGQSPPQLTRESPAERQPITELLQTIDVLAPVLYGLDEQLQGLDARAFMHGLQQFFHGWNHVTEEIDNRIRFAIDNLLRVILARGDLHYSHGKLTTSAHYLQAYFKNKEPHELEDDLGFSEIRMGMHELYCDLAGFLDRRKDLRAADLLALRVMQPLVSYCQSAWMEPSYPLIDSNIHRSLRELLEYLLPRQLSYAMPDRLDRIRNIDLQSSCSGQWENLRNFEENQRRLTWSLIWDSLRPNWLRKGPKIVSGDELLK